MSVVGCEQDAVRLPIRYEPEALPIASAGFLAASDRGAVTSIKVPFLSE